MTQVLAGCRVGELSGVVNVETSHTLATGAAYRPEQGEAQLRTSLACLALFSLVLLGGCTGNGDAAQSADTATPSRPSPTLGGQTALRPKAPPTAPMDDLEKPIAKQLAAEVAAQGLSLSYLDCPTWNKKVPGHLICVGYFNGVKARVQVRLRAVTNGAVRFEATLQRGVIATGRLVDELRRDGYTHVDCGDTPAYPATVGSKVVCAVSRHGKDSYVVATVTNTSGAVKISGF